MRKSKFLQLSYRFKILKKFYLFYNIYIRNRKYLNNGSQFGEDKFLYNLFEKNYVGKYLDVGCFHPTKHNNTSLFYKNGWQGINIDLNSLAIDLFNFMRPNDININTAVSSEESEKTLFFLSENNTQNTLSENQLLFLKKHHNLRDDEIIKKIIQTRRLDNILKENNFDNIDFMNLDVEGHELDVLKSGQKTLKKFKPLIHFELAPYLYREYGYNTKKIINFITKILGYEFFSEDFKKINNIREIANSITNRSENFFLIHKEKVNSLKL